MTIHPQGAWEVARLRHGESVARAERLARAGGFDLPQGGRGAGAWRIRELARLALRRPAAGVPPAQPVPAPPAGAPLAPTPR